jgi:predicted DNA-binding transcriptional regulator AlpA
MLQRRLRLSDLIELGIVKNRPTLHNWIRDLGFPLGKLTGPNSRTWTEDEVQEWIDSRPTALKETPSVPKGKRGRPRKVPAQVDDSR